MASPAESPLLAHPPRLRRIIRSFVYAGGGLALMLRGQPNFLVHIAAATLSLILAVVLRLSPAELALIVLTVDGVRTQRNSAAERAAESVAA